MSRPKLEADVLATIVYFVNKKDLTSVVGLINRCLEASFFEGRNEKQKEIDKGKETEQKAQS